MVPDFSIQKRESVFEIDAFYPRAFANYRVSQTNALCFNMRKDTRKVETAPKHNARQVEGVPFAVPRLALP